MDTGPNLLELSRKRRPFKQKPKVVYYFLIDTVSHLFRMYFIQKDLPDELLWRSMTVLILTAERLMQVVTLLFTLWF